MPVPMVDVARQYQDLKAEIDAAVGAVLESGRFILGPNMEALEEEVARYLGVGHAVAVGSGTDALHLGLRAAGIGPGDEVITTAFTFAGTAEAVAYTGARPVFVDIDPDTFNIDPAHIEAAIGPATRAVIAVHLFGQPAEAERIRALCDRHGLLLLEDCAQSFGASLGSRKTGAHGHLGCFSFYPGKNLGGAGDSGLVATGDGALAEKIRSLRHHGAEGTCRHGTIGYNSRMDEMQAAILRVKLPHIDRFNAARRRNAEGYHRRLSAGGVTLPIERIQGTHVYHQYTIRCPGRDRVRERLSVEGIATGVYYPLPLHRQPAFREACAALQLPATESAARTVLSLPMYPELTEEQLDGVCRQLREAL
ncbi:MAG: DegT/DnrJ/EryC1/StrS family aminotransferase [Gammaproteobacteria bacterium]|nr:DegT/DnrJ/EryC1/StrS family aminotransferase [Gammaproteobacteria bacterium]NIR97507.1 DegT/DnrJ/EryC1/StrS family aminotransferase [Gammaproteobacteria bacterium]NIT63145.1 DegT/DnrJ/EryC1/StrS family aminotransferase [Gammaproteobacteria bacterium]NIV19264.1 aminotransferase class I/II-fold pyridoxal phosphate-dependent enzyme [Gammaproteobacteria bacterium]NIX10254.1 aminotransferase class I/II-fold pyridoxal phosphate-dependent enzyme [Gammaproteobacteria bacterium]